jgi:AcrR family transcriptional regulator
MSTAPPPRRGRPPSGGREAILTATLELLRERGIARLTTREVAQRAGVSEASVFYHYTDRPGLLRAVFAAGLAPLLQLSEGGIGEGPPGEALLALSEAIERFLDQALPVMMAAQSDTALRDTMAVHLEENGLGPHRGIAVVAGYLAARQARGDVADDVDAEAIGLLLVGACFLRSAHRQIMGSAADGALPGIDRAVAAIERLLPPSGS